MTNDLIMTTVDDYDFPVSAMTDRQLMETTFLACQQMLTHVRMVSEVFEQVQPMLDQLKDNPMLKMLLQ